MAFDLQSYAWLYIEGINCSQLLVTNYRFSNASLISFRCHKSEESESQMDSVWCSIHGKTIPPHW